MRLILNYKSYRSDGSFGFQWWVMCWPGECRVNLCASRCAHWLKGALKALLGLPQGAIYCSSVSSSVIYSILLSWTKRTRRLYERSSNANAVTLDTRLLDLGVSGFFVSTDLKPLSFHPPTPQHFFHMLFAHIQIKKWGPIQFVLLALWNCREEGK